MAINREEFRKSDINSAAIASGATVSLRYVGRYRFRLTDGEEDKYQFLNKLRVNNKSARKIRIHLNTCIETHANFLDMEPNSIMNINPEDGIRFLRFDVENLDTSTDVNANEVQVSAAKVVEINEATGMPSQTITNRLGVF